MIFCKLSFYIQWHKVHSFCFIFQISALRQKLPWQIKQRKFSIGNWVLNSAKSVLETCLLYVQRILTKCNFWFWEKVVLAKFRISQTFGWCIFLVKIFHLVAKYFVPKNALAKYIWEVLKNCSNEIGIRRGPPASCEPKIFIQIGWSKWEKRPTLKLWNGIISYL